MNEDSANFAYNGRLDELLIYSCTHLYLGENFNPAMQESS